MSKRTKKTISEEIKENAEQVSEELRSSESSEVTDERKPKTIEATASEETASQKKKLKFNARSFKHGSLSVVLTVVFIAAVVLVNIIVGLLSERFDTAADLTDTGLYTLDETTENYLENILETDITLTVLRTEKNFEEQSSPYKQVHEILKKWR